MHPTSRVYLVYYEFEQATLPFRITVSWHGKVTQAVPAFPPRDKARYDAAAHLLKGRSIQEVWDDPKCQYVEFAMSLSGNNNDPNTNERGLTCNVAEHVCDPPMSENFIA